MANMFDLDVQVQLNDNQGVAGFTVGGCETDVDTQTCYFCTIICW
ncbi:FDLD family class I lanthipeptide [Paenibacillus tyrfis]|nr:FDLD family class I lanthipeptide [Paenibacillus tyrfis]